MILKRLLRWKNTRPKSVLGIDIGTSTAKIAEVMRQKDRLVVRNIGMAEVPDHVIVDGCIANSDALLRVLSKLILVNGFSCQEAVVAISGRNILVREVIFPLMTETELREAVKWDMEKYVPFTPETYYFDFAILPQSGEEQQMKVLLVVAPKEHVDIVIKVIKDLGLKPIAVEIESLALYRTLQCAEDSMVLNIGRVASQLILFQHGSPIVTRTISIGGQRFTEVIMRVLAIELVEAEFLKVQPKELLHQLELSGKEAEFEKSLELVVGEFVREILLTIEYYQIQNTTAVIDTIFLVGGGARLECLVQGLSESLSIPVRLHNPLSDLEIAHSFDELSIDKISPQLAVAIGLALRGGKQ
jgi:type IV pilus assembly protein PilM